MSVRTGVTEDEWADRIDARRLIDANAVCRAVSAMETNEPCSGPKARCADLLARSVGRRWTVPDQAHRPLRITPEQRCQRSSDPYGQRTSPARFSSAPAMLLAVLPCLSGSAWRRSLEHRSSSPSSPRDHVTGGRRQDGSSGSPTGRWRWLSHSYGAHGGALRKDA